MLLYITDCSSAHRDLHTFPTRRSSDLAQIQQTYGGRGRPFQRHPVQGEVLLDGGAGLGQRGDRLPDPSSEEDTSELQSRRELVFRLPLEIKHDVTVLSAFLALLPLSVV